MTELKRRMLEDMQLRGLAKNTQQSYMDCVKALAKHYNRRPDQLSEDEIRNFFLYLIKNKRLRENTIRIYVYGIKFFFEKTVQGLLPVGIGHAGFDSPAGLHLQLSFEFGEGAARTVHPQGDD